MPITSKDFQNVVSKSKVDVNIDIAEDLESLNRRQQTELKNLIGQTLIEEVQKFTSQKQASVNQAGSNAFPKLSKEYRKKKLASGKGGQPNLRLTDEMMDELFYQNKSDSVSLRLTTKLSKAKAENHNKAVTLPKRQFLPTADGQGFRREILKVVNQKIRDYKKSIKK